MTSLSTILVNRLVMNLREQAVEKLPTTIETMGKFQADLPVLRAPLSITSIRNPSFVRQDRSTVTLTHETVASVPAGEFPSQQVRTMDVIGYETEQISQAISFIGRQQLAISGSVRSLSSVRQNRSIGEMVSVGTTTESHRSADDATGCVPVGSEIS